MNGVWKVLLLLMILPYLVEASGKTKHKKTITQNEVHKPKDKTDTKRAKTPLHKQIAQQPVQGGLPKTPTDVVRRGSNTVYGVKPSNEVKMSNAEIQKLVEEERKKNDEEQKLRVAKEAAEKVHLEQKAVEAEARRLEAEKERLAREAAETEAHRLEAAKKEEAEKARLEKDAAEEARLAQEEAENLRLKKEASEAKKREEAERQRLAKEEADEAKAKEDAEKRRIANEEAANRRKAFDVDLGFLKKATDETNLKLMKVDEAYANSLKTAADEAEKSNKDAVLIAQNQAVNLATTADGAAKASAEEFTRLKKVLNDKKDEEPEKKAVIGPLEKMAAVEAKVEQKATIKSDSDEEDQITPTKSIKIPFRAKSKEDEELKSKQEGKEAKKKNKTAKPEVVDDKKTEVVVDPRQEEDEEIGDVPEQEAEEETGMMQSFWGFIDFAASTVVEFVTSWLPDVNVLGDFDLEFFDNPPVSSLENLPMNEATSKAIVPAKPTTFKQLSSLTNFGQQSWKRVSLDKPFVVTLNAREFDFFMATLKNRKTMNLVAEQILKRLQRSLFSPESSAGKALVKASGAQVQHFIHLLFKHKVLMLTEGKKDEKLLYIDLRPLQNFFDYLESLRPVKGDIEELSEEAHEKKKSNPVMDNLRAIWNEDNSKALDEILVDRLAVTKKVATDLQKNTELALKAFDERQGELKNAQAAQLIADEERLYKTFEAAGVPVDEGKKKALAEKRLKLQQAREIRAVHPTNREGAVEKVAWLKKAKDQKEAEKGPESPKVSNESPMVAPKKSPEDLKKEVDERNTAIEMVQQILKKKAETEKEEKPNGDSSPIDEKDKEMVQKGVSPPSRTRSLQRTVSMKPGSKPREEGYRERRGKTLENVQTKKKARTAEQPMKALSQQPKSGAGIPEFDQQLQAIRSKKSLELQLAQENKSKIEAEGGENLNADTAPTHEQRKQDTMQIRKSIFTRYSQQMKEEAGKKEADKKAEPDQEKQEASKTEEEKAAAEKAKKEEVEAAQRLAARQAQAQLSLEAAERRQREEKEKQEAEKEADEKARHEQVEAVKKEAAAKAEQEKQEAARKAELEKQEAARKAELEKQEAARKAELEKKEAARKAELEKQEAAEIFERVQAEVKARREAAQKDAQAKQAAETERIRQEKQQREALERQQRELAEQQEIENKATAARVKRQLEEEREQEAEKQKREAQEATQKQKQVIVDSSESSGESSEESDSEIITEVIEEEAEEDGKEVEEKPKVVVKKVVNPGGPKPPVGPQPPGGGGGGGGGGGNGGGGGGSKPVKIPTNAEPAPSPVKVGEILRPVSTGNSASSTHRIAFTVAINMAAFVWLVLA